MKCSIWEIPQEMYSFRINEVEPNTNSKLPLIQQPLQNVPAAQTNENYPLLVAVLLRALSQIFNKKYNGILLVRLLNLRIKIDKINNLNILN